MVPSLEFHHYSVFKEPEDGADDFGFLAILRTGPASWRLTLQALAHLHHLAAGRGSLHLRCWPYTSFVFLPANDFAALAPSRTTSEASPQDSGDKSSAGDWIYIESSVIMTREDSKSPKSLKVFSSGNFYQLGSCSRTCPICFPHAADTFGDDMDPTVQHAGGRQDRACNLHLPMLCPSPFCKAQLSYNGLRLEGGPCTHVAFTS